MACGSPTAPSSRPSSWCGRPASRRRTCSRTSPGSRPTGSTSWWCGQTLQTTRDDNIFAIGDCAACPWPGHPTPVPPRAQAAHQQASHLARALPRHLKGEPLPDGATAISARWSRSATYSTVGNLMGKLVGGNLFIEGLFAGLMYKSLYKMHQLALHGPAKVALDTLARLITRRTEPHVKLH